MKNQKIAVGSENSNQSVVVNSIKNESLIYLMKNFCVLITIFIVALNNTFGKIKNGYENEIFALKESLKIHGTLLHGDTVLTAYQRKKIEHGIDSLVSEISKYEFTENLLTQFKIISADLYAEIDTLKDITGRNVDVYVKFIPVNATKVKAWGTTYMSEIGSDKNTFCSEYGMFTVSIKIWIVNKALFVLAHELGHVKYQVPHFAKYMKYYKNNYTFRVEPILSLGHNTNDLSGRSAMEYVKRFRKEYIYFLKTKTEKMQPPLLLMTRIKRKLTHDSVNLRLF